MKFYGKGLDKRNLPFIIRQIDRQNKSVLFSCIQFDKGRFRDVLRPRLIRGHGAFFLCLKNLAITGKEVSAIVQP